MPRYVMVGCGPAASNAADAIREVDAKAEILMLSMESVRALARPRLVEYASGQIELSELETNEPDWYAERDIEVRLDTTVEGIDASARTLKLAGGETVEWDKLLAASGVGPRSIPLDGADLSGVFNMHHQPAADQVRAAVKNTKRAVVIGGGFLGQDMSMALAQVGVEVKLLVREDRVGVPQFDPASSEVLLEQLRGRGIDVQLETELARVEGDDGRVRRAVTKGGEAIDCQMVFLAVGAVPNAEWFAGSGAKVERGIVVDGQMRTAVDGIFAAGSCAEIHLEDRVLIQASWANAMAQGKVAGQNMAGGSEVYRQPSQYTHSAGEAKLQLFGAPASAYPDARFVILRASPEKYAALLSDGGVVRGGVLVGRHKKSRDIKALQLRDEPVPGLAEMAGEVDRDADEFIAEALDLD